MALIYIGIGGASPTRPDRVGYVSMPSSILKQTQPWKRMNDSLDQEQIRTRLQELESEHRDLDEIIIKLSGESYVNQFQIRRLKKRKLLLKDRIERLKSLLIPNLNA
ncbi:MAG: DUF465 domain-containing protein [Methylococcales bacterium]